MALVQKDDGTVELLHEKANLAPKATPITMEWRDGVLMPRVRSRLDERIAASNDADALLEALATAERIGVQVTAAMSGPVQFSHALKGLPEYDGPFGDKSGYARAKRALLVLRRDGRVRVIEFMDSRRHPRKRLEVAAAQAAASSIAPVSAPEPARHTSPIPPAATSAGAAGRASRAGHCGMTTRATGATRANPCPRCDGEGCRWCQSDTRGAT